MSSTRELTTRRTELAYQIRNIKNDYSAVDIEDHPLEVVKELITLMEELSAVRKKLAQ